MIRSDQYLIIIGAMKCGTSSLFSYLSIHPEICPSYHKEPEYFSSFPGVEKDQSYVQLWPDFDPSIHKYAMEASTGYTKFPACPDAPKRIKDAGIQPKLIYIVRNPFDRIVSHYNFIPQTRNSNVDIFDDHFLNVSRYYLQLGEYLKHFPADSLLVLDFDQLKKNPVNLLDKVYDFLDMGKRVYPESFEKVNALALESEYETALRTSALKSVLKYIPLSIKNRGKLLLRKLRPPQKRTLTSEEHEKMRELLLADIEAFSKKFNFDVSSWLK